MKKISIDFVSPKSQESEIYKFLTGKLSSEICSFDGFVNDNGLPQGSCAIGLGKTKNGFLMFNLSFNDGKLNGYGSLLELADDDTSNEIAGYNFLTENYGEIYFPNGNVYEGEIVGARQEGKGKITEPNGDFSIGFYQNGKRHGLMLHYDKDSNLVYKSVYYDGQLIISSDDDNEILSSLKKYDFNYSEVLNSLTKLKKQNKEDNLKNIKNGLKNIEKNMIGQKKF